MTAVLAALAVTLALQHASTSARSHRQAVALVGDYLEDWGKGSWKQIAALTAPAEGEAPVDPSSYLARTAAAMHTSSTTFTHPVVQTKGSRATASFRVTMQVKGFGDFSYDDSLSLVKLSKRGWRVSFREASVHPRLTAGTRLIRTRTFPQRGQVLTSDGRELGPLDHELDSNVVGSVGTMTAAQAKAKGPRFDEGDPVGVSGIELAMDSTLAATPGGSVAIADAKGKVLDTLQEWEGKPGSDVRTTFDLAMQQAAERTLSGLKQSAALVAIDTTSGAIKAIVNQPLGGFPRAVVGPYPPGSTFKIIDSTAALMAGRTASTSLQCPKELKVQGRTFVNAEDEELGTISFIDAFAQSCNTAFANLIQSMPLNAIHEASKLYGFTDSRDTPGPLTIPGVGGFAPMPSGYANAVGQGIGQDQIVASPVQMASVAAAVASGQWRQPYLLDPKPDNLAHHDIPVAAQLRDFMAAVVSRGTAKDAGLPAGTFGKTGTAEFGPGPPYKTHAWFVGFRGTTAFAVIVEDGGFGGEVAAPLAARFLRALG